MVKIMHCTGSLMALPRGRRELTCWAGGRREQTGRRSQTKTAGRMLPCRSRIDRHANLKK